MIDIEEYVEQWQTEAYVTGAFYGPALVEN